MRGYNPDGMDIDTLQIGQNKKISIFDGGGTHRSYEMSSGSLKPLDKQPKDLRFTGKYYSTDQLKPIFVDKIQKALAGGGVPLHKDFLESFNIKQPTP